MKKQILFLLLFVTTLLSAQSKFTSFNVNKHGYKFANKFKTTIGDPGSIKVTTGGLCGGMAYGAADYFYAGKSAPKQDYLPLYGSRLHKYIFDRQMHSFQSTDKWAELILGQNLRHEEFFYWGLENRLTRDLKRSIDRNRPVPLGLFGIHGSGHHQVLAIGYDMGGYRGKRDRDPNKEKVMIFIYDPNKPKKICALFPNTRNNTWEKYIVEKKRGKYRKVGKKLKTYLTYFIDENYRRATPPSNYNAKPTKSNLVSELLVEIETGGDDLRGGNDNVNIIVSLKGGKEKRLNCANRKYRWPDNIKQTVVVRLDRAVKVSDILGVRLETTFGGGMGGDNWNVNCLVVRAVKQNGKKEEIVHKSGKGGKPLKRFTGDRKTYYAKTKFSK